MRTWIGLTILALALAAIPVEAGGPPLSKLLDDPPATGMMISSVFEETAGKKAGMEVGDVIVSYGGRPIADLEALVAAKEATAGRESVEIKAVRDNRVIVFVLAPGQIGVNLIPVTKGVAAAPLPPMTEFAFDVSRLAKAPRDDWYEFSLPGTGKVGFEHAMLSVEDDHLVLRREVAFDGGEQWGINHFDVRVRMALTPRLHVVSTRFENPVTKWVGEGILDEENGHWVFAWGGEGHERGTRSMPVTHENVPDYILESLAALMPQEVGACFHYRTMATGWPGPALMSALRAAAEEELEIGGEKVKTLRFETTTRGGAAGNRHWVDTNGRIVQSYYGGAIARLTTKEKALADLHEKIVPRTAGAAEDPLEKILADPAATGMIALRIVSGSQAEKAGVRPGDILVSYNGEAVPDLPSIAAAKERAADREAVVLRINRGGDVLDLTFAPGRLGIYLLPVRESVAVPPLPKATVTRLDFAPLADRAREEWFSVYWGESAKLGYVRTISRFDGVKLFVRTEHAIDQGDGEYRHSVLAVVLRVAADGSVTPEMTREELRVKPPVRAIGVRTAGGGTRLGWSYRGPTRAFTGEIPADSIPATALPAIAGSMPREVGACLRFHPLYESVGEAALPGALVCAGAEEVALGGRSFTVFRYEWRELGGGVRAVYRIAADGRIIGSDHGEGVMALTATKEEALEGIPAGHNPR